MSNLTTIRGYYPLNTFGTLRDLWQQMAETICHRSGSTNEQNVRLVTNLELLPIQRFAVTDKASDLTDLPTNLPQFSLLQSDRFQALLTGNIINLANLQQIEIEITFTPAAIDRFIQPLIPYLPSTVQLIADPNFANDSDLQSYFTQLLLTAMVICQETDYTNKWMSEREIQLQQQVDRAHLLNYISTQIHQTLDLPIILQTVVDRIQTFLQADRLIIYQFEFAKINGKASNKSFDAYNSKGKVVYEAIGFRCDRATGWF
jgi:hypothetical protein